MLSRVIDLEVVCKESVGVAIGHSSVWHIKPHSEPFLLLKTFDDSSVYLRKHIVIFTYSHT